MMDTNRRLQDNVIEISKWKLGGQVRGTSHPNWRNPRRDPREMRPKDEQSAWRRKTEEAFRGTACAKTRREEELEWVKAVQVKEARNGARPRRACSLVRVSCASAWGQQGIVTDPGWGEGRQTELCHYNP